MVAFFLHALVSIFAVMNPFGILPTFLALTTGYSQREQRDVAKRTVLHSFVILLAFLLLGNFILQMFSITISAFRVAGGILLFGIAYDLLHAKPSPIQDTSEETELVSSADGEPLQGQEARPDITITPLAIPVIAGPGTITSVMALAAGPNLIMRSGVVFVAFSVVLAITFLIFYYASHIHQRISQTGLNVITRLMGFLLSIIAIQMAATGLGQLFPGLLHV
ncbi:MarC family protein [Alicyclobacillus ferrooxydans]|uniref:UPF0056 membrane protein n=1 Tax=Alicyclobacillus ferrooxydans TaxID=471514 RepID=A0A0P9CYV3_9BACL|nr:MarC family protein [Alicyclobacillus ferrooxydans]KPV42151.1 hypothetical protein AN477_19090 [Alicyclobacillus ferrooxydans]